MQTIAIISDLHANVVALDVVLRELESLRPDHVVCLGDVAATGPAPREVIARLRDREWSFVRGNCDDNLVRYAAGDDAEVRDEHDEIDRWCASALSEEDLQFIAGFESTVSLNAEGVDLCCFHGSPQSNLDIILAETTAEELDRLLEGVRVDVYAGGHTHTQLVRRYRRAFVINPGSVGLPFTLTANGREINPLCAEYAVLHVDGTDIGIELRRVAVKRDELLASAAISGMPAQDWWTRDWEE